MAKVSNVNIPELVKWTLIEQMGADEAEITPEANFINDLGCDSLDIIELVMAFEEKLDIEIPDEDIEKMPTVSEAVSYLQGRA